MASPPAVIGIESAVMLAVNPGAIVPIVSVYVANAVVREAFRRAEWNVGSDDTDPIADAIADLKDTVQAMLEADDDGTMKAIAQILLDKLIGVENLTLNIGPTPEIPDYTGSWSITE